MKLRIPRVDRLDLHVYGGLVLLAGGVAWIYPPAGVVVAGGVLLMIGIWASLPESRRPED